MASMHDDLPSGASVAQERELKLECDPRDVGRLLHHPLVASARAYPESSGILEATYFDTPDQTLRRAGIALRIRKHHARHIQTIKAEKGPRGIALDRTEWDTEVNGPTLDRRAAAGTPLAPFLDEEAIGSQIQPVFTVRTRRHAFLIETHGATIELVLDRTILKCGRRASHLTEIELELKAGEPSALFLTARDLAREVPLRLSTLAKSDRGYRLLERSPPAPVKARPPKIRAGTTSAEAFQVIAREALSQFLRNEELWRSFADPEALHQMRVGLRRLKTAVSLFKPTFSSGGSRRVKADLRRIARLLGPARDLDVLSQGLQEEVNRPTEGDVADIEQRRTAAYANIRRKLDKPRLKRAILHLAVWIEAGKWLTVPSGKVQKVRSRPVERLAKKRLARGWKTILRDSRRIEKLSIKKRHALRMRIKALRYGTEFFAGTFKKRGSGPPRNELVRTLERLQDVLGDMNDVAFRQQAFPDRAAENADRCAAAIGVLMPNAQKAAHRLPSLKPFWQ